MNRNSFSIPFSLWAAGSLALLSACASDPAPPSEPAGQNPTPAAATQDASDFPTQARVEYVLQCMQEHGGQNYDNLYHCVCAVDKLASRMNYQEYSESLTFTYLFDTPGEKGGEFRDPPKSKELREKLKVARKEAEGCFPDVPQKVEGKKK
jgi:hypothetical protein